MNSLRLPFAVVAAFLSLTPAAAQSPASAPAQPNDGQIMEWMRGEQIPPIANLPFTAKVQLETVNQLTDGTFITHRTYNIDARDSSGRTRVERRRWINDETDAEPQLLRFILYDPARRTRTVVLPLIRTVRLWTPVSAFPGEASTTLQKAVTSRENLGADTMEGLPVRGMRETQIYASGALGNNRSLTIVTEN